MLKIDKNKTVQGLRIWELPAGPIDEAAPLCRKIAADGAVLLKNNGVLPFKKGERVAVFGRMQTTYYKSGTGSGGAVNVKHLPCIIESLRKDGGILVDEPLAKIYEAWIEQHPFDNGHGWASEPCCQVEMPLEEPVVCAAAERNSSAVVIIGRSSGEDHDNAAEPGSYLLTEVEENMIRLVAAHFKKFVVVLNVGNIIDLKFTEKYSVPAFLYAWQGGMEGANALADILCGRVSPGGKLPDTQAFDIEDYPSTANFNDPDHLYYKEDIFVGYRYFETFAKEKVQYPFGFGLTYTTFNIRYSAKVHNGEIAVTATVQNTGNFAAREVVQVYYGAPCAKLCNPAKQLVGFAKTKTLAPGEEQTLTVSFSIKKMAAFDDSGVTGFKNAYVLEAGNYRIFAGTDVRSSKEVLCYRQESTVAVQQLQEAMAPQKSFERLQAQPQADGTVTAVYTPVPTAETNMEQRALADRPEEIAYTGDRGIKLVDVALEKAELKDFIAQMSDTDLCTLVLGEGMCSPKVTPGTGAAFGGVTNALLDFGIPVLCASDGPAGLRLATGLKATSIPIGTLLAATFDEAAMEALHEFVGMECFAYKVDTLLAPGMNIHRNPLNGRNFEYYSEDPLLTGKMGAAASRGVAKTGSTTTIKHFCCNNRERGRWFVEAVVSARALREIYLRGFEIAVKEGHATAIMTSYNPVNGYWTSSNYDLNTTILRNEWGYNGIVMTDWWALSSCAGEAGKKGNQKAMIRAQNDIFMVCPSAETQPTNLFEGMQEGYITRGSLQRCVANLLRYIMLSPTFLRFVDSGCKKPIFEAADESKMQTVVHLNGVQSNTEFTATFGEKQPALVKLKLQVTGNELAQSPITLTINGESTVAFSVNGNGGKEFWVTRLLKQKDLKVQENKVTLTFEKAVTVLELEVKV